VATQRAFRVRFEWAVDGVLAVANRASAAVIVDVLSFSTCVDIATGRGVRVLPYRDRDAGAAAFAAGERAMLAVRRGESGPSLSPRTLTALAPRDSRAPRRAIPGGRGRGGGVPGQSRPAGERARRLRLRP
jgi:2-phosphosulfolactate phosphatase